MPKTLSKRLNEGQKLQQAITNHMRSDWNRTARLNKRVQEILEQPIAYFITFTLNNEHIDLKDTTIRKKIALTLRHAKATTYLYNRDYGKNNNRLHYHALAGFNLQLDYNIINSIYTYGAINIKQIHIKNEEALKRYITKQQLHASKQTASKIYYSRERRSKNEY